jgi:hypothetical protein
MNMLEILANCGSPQAGFVFRPMACCLNQIYGETSLWKYSKIATGAAIGLLVSGRVYTFDGDGPGQVSFSRKNRVIYMDLTFRRCAWEKKRMSQSRDLLIQGLRSTFAHMKNRLVELDENAQADAWEADFERALLKFVKESDLLLAGQDSLWKDFPAKVQWREWDLGKFRRLVPIDEQ